MSVSDGALGVKHVVTVNAEKDHHPNSRIRMSAVHSKLPDELIKSMLNFENGANRESAETILELKDLVEQGDANAALMLGMVNWHNFEAVVKTGEKRVTYLKEALDSDDKKVKEKAYKQLALYYCSKYELKK